MKLRRPKALHPGSTVAVVAPASLSSPERIDAGLSVLDQLGYRVRVMSHDGDKSRHYLAGSDGFRAGALTDALTADDVDGVWCLRGGYGTIRTLDKLSSDVLASTTKPVIGFSDVTVLLLALHKMGCVGLHGPVVTQLPNLDTQSLDHLQAMLQGAATSIPLAQTRQVLQSGCATGPLLGGNLSMICSLIGTGWQPSLADSILFLEDVGEPTYRVDRLLTQLRLAGMLDRVRGVVIGDFTNVADGDLASLDDLFGEFASWIDGPVVRGLPCGHGARNVTLPVGVPVVLDSTKDSLVLEEPAFQRESPTS